MTYDFAPVTRVRFRFTLAIIFVLANMAFAKAETLEVSYKSFYSHVNKLKGEETEALQFAFGFMNIKTQSLCAIKQARISTEKQQIPLTVIDNRFTVPSERALRLADALVILDLAEPANICDMSVQLETKPELLKTEYSNDDLLYLYQQYTSFFDEMGGFLSFMMPKVTGIKLYFEDKTLTQKLADKVSIENGQLSLSAENITAVDSLSLAEAPLRITAITSK